MSSPTSIPKPPQQTAQQAGEKRTAPSLSPEITVVDGTESLSAPPPAKKPRMSGSGSGAGDGDAGSVDDKENSKTPAFAAAANSKTTTTIKATTATPKKPSTGVKKTIFMPGFGPKPTSPAIPKQLAENLSVPLPPTSSAPATAGAAPDIAALKRDFVDALPADLKELLDMEIETMGDDWFVALRGEFVKPYFRDLKKFVIAEQKSKKVFPPAEDVYSWTRLCPLSGIRVVIIGQDPYHDDGQAHGLAFSVRKGIRTPPSLRNIYKEIGEEIKEFTPPAHGHLTSWARQGVLLLNTCLTVRAHEAASHSKKGWETFTTAVLKTIVDRLAPTGAEQGARGVVFLAWGAPAGKLCAGISEKSHHVLRSAHPSPLAASRGFFGNKHFVQCNEWLEDKYGPGKGIDWTSVMRD